MLGSTVVSVRGVWPCAADCSPGRFVLLFLRGRAAWNAGSLCILLRIRTRAARGGNRRRLLRMRHGLRGRTNLRRLLRWKHFGRGPGNCALGGESQSWKQITLGSVPCPIGALRPSTAIPLHIPGKPCTIVRLRTDFEARFCWSKLLKLPQFILANCCAADPFESGDPKEMILEPNILGTKHKCFGLYRRRRLLTSRRCRRLDYHWGRGAQARSLQCVRVALPHQQIPTASEKPGEDATQIVTPLHQCFRTASDTRPTSACPAWQVRGLATSTNHSGTPAFAEMEERGELGYVMLRASCWSSISQQNQA